jgi:hypothetical protein
VAKDPIARVGKVGALFSRKREQALAADAADAADAAGAAGAMMDNARSDGTEYRAGGDSSDDYDEEVVVVTDVSDLTRAYQHTAGTATNCALGFVFLLFLFPALTSL